MNRKEYKAISVALRAAKKLKISRMRGEVGLHRNEFDELVANIDLMEDLMQQVRVTGLDDDPPQGVTS